MMLTLSIFCYAIYCSYHLLLSRHNSLSDAKHLLHCKKKWLSMTMLNLNTKLERFDNDKETRRRKELWSTK